MQQLISFFGPFGPLVALFIGALLFYSIEMEPGLRKIGTVIISIVALVLLIILVNKLV